MSELFTILACDHGNATSRTPVLRRRDYSVCTVEYVVSGKGVLEIDGHTFEVKPESVYFLHKHSTHSYWPDRNDPWQKLYFVADGPLMEQMFQHYGLADVYVLPDCSSAGDFFWEMLELKPHEMQNRGFMLFHQLIEHLSRVNSPAEEETSVEERLKKSMDESLEMPFLLKQYARKTGYSEAHLIRIFREKYNVTPHRYLLDLRLEAARQLLLYSRLSVKEIADRFCFSSQYYFSGSFHEKYGNPPREFREKYGP